MNGQLVLSQLGRQIKQLRSEKDLTLDELAVKADVSTGLLSQLERGVGNPSFITLMKVAAALEVDSSVFFEGSEPNGVLVRKDKRKRLIIPERGLIHELLTPDLKRSFEVLLCRFQVGSADASPYRHKGEELLFVTEGTFTFHLGDQTYELAPGDSITFRGETSHWGENPGPVDAVVLMVIAPPVF